MNKPELESILKKARLPEISEESLAMFPRRIVARLKRNDPPAPPRAKIFAAPGVGLWTGGLRRHRLCRRPLARANRNGNNPSPDSLASAKLVHEIMAMFPNQIRAIVQDDGGDLKLVLSDTGDVPASPPLYVRICDGKHCLVLRDLQRPGNPSWRDKKSPCFPTRAAGSFWPAANLPGRAAERTVRRRPLENRGQKSRLCGDVKCVEPPADCSGRRNQSCPKSFNSSNLFALLMKPPRPMLWRVLRRCLIGLGVCLILIGLFYAEEGWRGERAWKNCKRALQAQGAKLDWADLFPPKFRRRKMCLACRRCRSGLAWRARSVRWQHGKRRSCRKNWLIQDGRKATEPRAWSWPS